MDRLNQIKGESGGSRDLTLDTSSPPSESFMTANESSSKYFSLSEVDSTFDVSPSKDSAISTTPNSEQTLTDSELIPNLSPIPKKVDSFQIGKQIEAANILSGGVNIFDDNDNSYDGNELVIDDNVPVEESCKTDEEHPFEKSVDSVENSTNVEEAIPSIDTEVVLQIDGKNVNAIAIGNGLYLYRKGVEELAAIQMIEDNQQQPSFKFLKVRDNAEGNLEVYEEIEVEVPNKVPIKEGKAAEKRCNVPVKDTCSQVKSEPSDKFIDNKCQKVDSLIAKSASNTNTDVQSESKSEVNFNGKKVKLNESRKSPLISTFTPMTYHSTPNKEGIPLTKTMVDQQLHPSRQSDIIKKTIEVHTDSCKRESPIKDNECEAIKPRELLVSALDKTVSQLELLNSSNVALEPNNAGKTDDTDNSKILQIKNIMNENEKLSPTAEISKEKGDDEHNNVLKNEKTNCENKIFNDNKSGVEINSNEEQCKNINNHIMKIDQKITSINDCKSKSNEILKPGIESKTSPADRAITYSLSLDDSKQKLVKPKSTHEPIDSLLKQTESKDETLKENKIIVPTPVDNVEQLQGLENTDTKTYKLERNKTFDVSLIEFDKGINIESSSKTLPKTNDTMQLSKNYSEKNLLPPKEEPTYHNKSNSNEPKTNQKLNTDDLTRERFETKNDLLTNHSLDNKDSNEIELSTKDLKPTEIISKACTLEKEDSCKGDGKVVDSNFHKKPTLDSDIGKDNISAETTPQVPNKNETLKGVKNMLEEISKTEITSGKSKDIKDIAKANFSKAIIKPQSKIEITKETSVSSKEMPEPHLKTNQPTNVIKNKAAGTNPTAVPFGKWTEANRQEFLNKIKETKIPGNVSNTKQLKQPNDLNRRDILKKIDTQRQAHLLTAKNQESAAHAKTRGDSSAAFVNKSISTLKTNEEQKQSTTKPDLNKNNPVMGTITFEEKYIEKNEALNTSNLNKTPTRRKEINNQDLIDKTIEGIISRAVSTKPHDEWKQTIKMDAAETLKHHNSIESLDGIERKMNELHGIPFVERPAHELPQVQRENKSENSKDLKSNTPLLSLKSNKDNITENISDEEILEHQPITGDMTGQNLKIYQSSYDKLSPDKSTVNEESKKDAVITEKDFDKFARRNSITYENRLTVEFDGKESHNVVQTLIEKEVPSKKMNRNEMMLAESKAKSTNKHLMMRHNINSSKSALLAKVTNEEDSYNKNYQSQSKVQLAYQSALTAKRQLECPVTILEDKPVKVVFLESSSDFASSTLNVQGKELSPSKKIPVDSDSQSASESLDSDVVDCPYEAKSQDETRSKSKHQRKQVLTPVDAPELELIEPSDLSVSESPKKRRKVDETKEKTKNLAPKKSYLLNRAPTDDKTMIENSEIKSNECVTDSKPFVVHCDPISAIDNLVKAAELIETQSEKKTSTLNLPESDVASRNNTPTKRGRGRPRKYPLSETSQPINKTPTPKKPRLVDSNIILSKKVIESDDSDDSNEEFIKENWTMGKINENIVCPICNKLFRSENVVFKHVKHCTGPSPNRSESSRSFRKFSQSEGKSDDSDSNISDSEDDKPIKPKAKATKPVTLKKEDVIVIEDTPQKKMSAEVKLRENNKPVKTLPKSDNLVCEFCGKTFRQLSYLVNHKLLHKKEEQNDDHVNKSIFSCEVCKKEFRKLHHLVQHRIIHNPNTMSSRLSRKNSNDKNEAYSVTDTKKNKHDEDQSAGFRCEPCDKSFRKLHHLVEHRETHDGINKKVSSNNGSPSNETIKTTYNYVCSFCSKSFKKLQQLTEHKEQHCDSCSEKSDDVKSVKSSLSTKDIIHECSLCYMVFPNEHSLNKHTIICLRKKKQSAAKQAKLLEQKEKNGQDILPDEDKISEIDIHNQSDKNCETETNSKDDEKSIERFETVTPITEVSEDKKNDGSKIEKENIKIDEVQVVSDRVENTPLKRSVKEEEKSEKPVDTGKKHSKIRKIEVITIPDTPTPKKKTNNIETKKYKPATEVSAKVINEKDSTDVSDDDEVRYMLNPNIKEDVPEEKVFMKVRANKRSSLQFERPNSKDLVKRRISLQNLPKVQRSKIKLTENNSMKPKSDKTPDIQVKTEQTDSDDSDVKYSFPENILQSIEKDKPKTIKKDVTVSKRKSITGIAKRKSLVKHKIPVPSQKIKRRTTEVEHRCDCGQLFSSAAMLSRHTTLAHTPPRVRRPRDPPPPPPHKTQTKTPPQAPAEKRKILSEQSKVGVQQKKSGARSKVPTTKSRKTIVDNKTSGKVVKSESNSKTLRSAAHKGVPVPDKMKKFMDKFK